MSHHSIAKKQNRQLGAGVFEVWKERGETLKVLLERFKTEMQLGANVPMTYAGRLDPMAEGIVIVLTGDARFEKEKYMGRSKTYQFEVLLGVATDTYDVLGVITDTVLPVEKEISESDIEITIEKFTKSPLPYPPFSSKPVDGVPLFIKAREGELPEVMPLQLGVPKEIIFNGKSELSILELVKDIIVDIKKVKGDFRQEEIRQGWEALAQTHPEATVSLLSFEAIVPSGVYIRSIAHALGELLGTKALAYSIVRTTIHQE